MLNQENVLLEGAQGALLDLDLGTYPHVKKLKDKIRATQNGSIMEE